MFRHLRVFHFPAIDRLWKFLIPAASYSVAVYAYHFYFDPPSEKPPAARLAEIVVSTLLFGWLMQFRAATAYDRWWEGRKLWGQLVNASRNIALKSVHLVGITPADRSRLSGLLSGFAEALLARLARPRNQPGELEASRVPIAEAGRIYSLLGEWSAGGADSWKMLALDTEIRQLMDVAGACERIRSTPLAASYRGLLRKGIGIYLLALPWIVFEDMGAWCILTTVVVSYVLIGLELIADDLENPFDAGPDSLRLAEITRVIRETAAAYADGSPTETQGP